MASYRKNLTLSLGPISTSVDLETVAPKVKTGLNRICPEHSVKLSQKYQCPGTGTADEHTVTWGSWNVGREGADGFVVVDVDKKPSVEGVGGLSLTPVPKKGLEASTLEGEGMYYAVPSTEHAQATWAIFRKLVAGKTTLVARGALRKGVEKLWKITTFDDYLVLREVIFPENLKPSPEAVGTKVDKETYDLVNQFVENLSTDWDDFDSSDTMAARMEEWMSNGTTVEAGDVAVEGPPAMDLNAALREALK